MTVKGVDDTSTRKLRTLHASLQEITLQTRCKNLLKNQLFRGVYQERSYVEQLQAYRDKICLNFSEKDVKNTLLNVTYKLHNCYNHKSNIPWIGITDNVENIYIWTEINNLAFGEYWFIIKTIQFNENEVSIRVKAVRPIETDVNFTGFFDKKSCQNNTDEGATCSTSQVDWKDYLKLLSMWLDRTKTNTYYFLSQDLSIENTKALCKFVALFVVLAITGLFTFIKFLGYFVIRLMHEINGLISVLTPITIKIIDVFCKIIGGIFILLAMVYNDCFGRNRPQYNQNDYWALTPPPQRASNK